MATNRISKKKELQIYREFLIRLHTYSWTAPDKFKIAMDALFAYSYSRTNSNPGDAFYERKQQRLTLLQLEKV